MAVPMHRKSRSRTRSRRARWRAEVPDLVEVRVDGVVHRVPRRLVRALRQGVVDVDAVRSTSR